MGKSKFDIERIKRAVAIWLDKSMGAFFAGVIIGGIMVGFQSGSAFLQARNEHNAEYHSEEES